MASRKITISLPEEVLEQVNALTQRSGTAVSAWIARAAREQARIEDGLAAIREWEQDAGALTPAELATARAALASADVQRLKRRRRTS